MPSKFTVAADGNYAGSLVKLARYSKRNWKTRYFTLTASPPELCYFKKKGDAKEAGKITIDASTTAELANDARPNCFRVSNSAYGDLFLQAPSKKEQETWMAKITFVAQLELQTKQAWRKSVAAVGSVGGAVAGAVRPRLGSSAFASSLGGGDGAGSKNGGGGGGGGGGGVTGSSSSSPAPAKKPRRNIKVELAIEKFLADKERCSRFYESAEWLVVVAGTGRSGAPSQQQQQQQRSSSARSTNGRGVNVEELFPAKVAGSKAGLSEQLKALLLHGTGNSRVILELGVPSVGFAGAGGDDGGAGGEGDEIVLRVRA